MATDVPFSCHCGEVTGRLTDIHASAGTRLACHCASCRDAVNWLSGDATEPEGVGYYQTSPDHITFETGFDRVAAFTWKQRTLLRWFATCCNAPLFNTSGTPAVAFASLYVDRVQDPAPLGRISAHAFLPAPGGATRHKGMVPLVWAFARRLATARLSGRWKETPFFDVETRKPVVPVRHLTPEDRTAPFTPAE